MPNHETHVADVLRYIADQTVLVVLRQGQMQVDGYQVLALRDHLNGSKNGLNRIRQTFKAFIPNAKIIPPNIHEVI